MATGQTVQFKADVTGTDKKDVQWTILRPLTSAGSIDANGLYKAPNTALMAPITISAETVASPLKEAFANVWILGPGTVSRTNNPLVARYSIVAPDGGKVKIEFGPDTSYGRDTWSKAAPSGGGLVNILVAGMRASSTYHMRAITDMPNGTQVEDVDHNFQTGALPAGRVPQIAVQTPGSLTPNPSVELFALANARLTTNPLEAVVTDLQGNII